MIALLAVTAVIAADPRAKITRDVPHHELAILSDCSADDVTSIAQEIQVAISLGAPAYNKGDREACYRVYSNAAVALDRRLPKCTKVRKALLAGVDRSSHLNTFDEKAWAMRDAFDGVLDVIARSGVKAPEGPKRDVPRFPLRALDDCAEADQRRIARAIAEAIEVGAPAFNDGRVEACYRLYQGTALELQDSVAGCTVLKRALQKGVDGSRAAKTPDAKALAMRDVFDGVMELFERSHAPKTDEL